ncbi:MAG: S4 domain-containing protein [Erythrobacter sp.]
MRLDRLLVYLRFARTRSAACRLVQNGALRRNRIRVQRTSEKIAIGDVLTFALGNTVRVIEIVALPERRGSPARARSHYRDLDHEAELPLAAPRKAPGTDPISDMKDRQ